MGVLTAPAGTWYESLMPLVDDEIRARVFSWLDLQVALYGVAIIEVLGAWMDLYVPQPFVYNKF